MIGLADLRRRAGVTQAQLALSLGTSQGQISRLERQDDMLISTLTSYLSALGANAKVVVEAGGQTLTYDLTSRRRPK